MKHKSSALRYSLLTSRWDQLWLPIGFWALFAILVAIMLGQKQSNDLTRGFLGVMLPLLAGIQAAYAFLDDPALELQFSSPVPAGRALAQRLGIILIEMAIAAVTFQVFAWALRIDISSLGGLLERQLTWLLPCLAMIGLGSFGAFALANSTGGALLVGLVWIVQLILHGWFPAEDLARPFFLFFRIFGEGYPGLVLNQLVMLGLGVFFLGMAWALLRKQERYI